MVPPPGRRLLSVEAQVCFSAFAILLKWAHAVLGLVRVGLACNIALPSVEVHFKSNACYNEKAPLFACCTLHIAFWLCLMPFMQRPHSTSGQTTALRHGPALTPKTLHR